MANSSSGPDGNEAFEQARARGRDIRSEIPAAGLREYWYPVARARDVKRRKPLRITALKEQIVLFHAENDEIAAVSRFCPHRGGDLAHGKCAVRGTISCPYHGWTFDKQGICVAVLGEGPESRMPGQKNSNVKSYPVQTLKGVVFVWIGGSEPAPINEDVPPEFFRADGQVFTEITEWASNWRPAVENYQDAHVFYVHRNSLRVLALPTARQQSLLRGGARRPRPESVNERALSVPGQAPGLTGLTSTISPAALAKSDGAPSRKRTRTWLPSSALQDAYPTLGGVRWPGVRVRYALSLIATVLRPTQQKAPLIDNQEWTGIHLPGIVRTDNSSYIYSRTIVPIDENHIRIVYYHTRLANSKRKRIWYNVLYHVFYNWWYNYNFSGQDGVVVEYQAYDLPEHLSQTDVFPLAWRRFVLRYARGLKSQRSEEV